MAHRIFRWWPFLGAFLFFGVLGHGGFGFGCHEDPGVTTDPSLPPENPEDPQPLTVAPASSPAVPSFSLAFIPVLGGLLAIAIGRWVERS